MLVTFAAQRRISRRCASNAGKKRAGLKAAGLLQETVTNNELT